VSGGGAQPFRLADPSARSRLRQLSRWQGHAPSGYKSISQGGIDKPKWWTPPLLTAPAKFGESAVDSSSW